MQKGLAEYLAYLLEVLIRRKWAMILFALATLVWTAFVTYRATPLYSASSQIESPMQRTLVPQENDRIIGSFLEAKESFHRNESMYITSNQFLQRVAKKLNPATVSQLQMGVANPDISSILGGMLNISWMEKTDILTVTVISTVPQFCAEIANTIAEEYKGSIIERFIEGKEKFSGEIEENILKRVEQQLKDKREERLQFLSSLGFTNMTATQNSIIQQMALVEQKISSLETSLLNLSTKMNYIISLKPLEDNALQIASILAKDGNALMGKLLEERRMLIIKLEELTRKYKDKWPAIVETKEKITLLDNSIVAEINNFLRNTERDVELLKNQLSEFGSKRNKLKQEVDDINKKLIKLESIETEIATLQQQYNYYMKLKSEAKVSQYSSETNARIIQLATVPLRPFKPNVKLNFIIGSMIAIFGGIGLCFLLDSFDSAIRYPEELEKAFGSIIIGVIPFLKSQQKTRQPVVIQKADSNAFEALRKLRTEINFYMNKTGHKIFTVLSSSPLEGKTTVALNIAHVLSLDNKSVLLIDADLRRPSLHHAAAKDPSDLLNQYFAGKIEVQDTIIPSIYDYVSIVATKSYFSDSPELLASDKFRNLLDYGRQNFDVVIVDTPPLLSLTDGGIVAKLVDASILVVRENFTKRLFVYSTQRHLNNLNINIAGIIMNCVREKGSYYYYYYYYSYYYNKYYSKYGYLPEEDATKVPSQVKSKGSADDEPPIVIT